MKELRRKVLLPVFQLSELTTEEDPRALKRAIPQGRNHAALTYHYRFAWDEDAGRGFNYNLFPVVLDRESAPWALGTLYILAQLEAESPPRMATYQSKADDLGAYKEWLDTQDLPEKLIYDFPQNKLRRPTYRYRGHLKLQIQAGELAPATAKRRMATVVSFYRWLISKNFFQPDYPPWEDRQYGLVFKSVHGREIFKKVNSTDLNIQAPKPQDPFAGTIQDGGKLRPLTNKEQSWILEATWVKGNTECGLIQLFMLSTGARIQTAGTLRLRHFVNSAPHYSKALTGNDEVLKLKAGPSTGIDTKNDKNGVLLIPRNIYELLHTYALSYRANLRRSRFYAKHGNHDDPYLFLTQQGNPYYTSKTENLKFNPDLNRRHEKVGQPIRQFIKDHAIPYVREHYCEDFHYRIHDLRASFGMSMTELLLTLVEDKQISLNQARMIVKDLLWHESLSTTDLYLDYKIKMDQTYSAINGFGKQLKEWCDQAMKSMETTDE